MYLMYIGDVFSVVSTNATEHGMCCKNDLYVPFKK